MATKKKQAKQFTYGVGFYWEGESGSVGLYAHGNELFHGTMAQAQSFRNYIQECEVRDKKKKADRKDWRIFQLIEIPEVPV